MTKQEARELLESSREDYDGKDPGNVMLGLRRVLESASPQERVVLNEEGIEYMLLR